MVSEAQILQDLTQPQRQAVTHDRGPLLIVAGAGSGKTRVITRRVAYLIGRGVPPASICAITFTNKAAGEMKERVGQLLGRPLRDFGRLDLYWPTICTFHSLCLRILRHYAPQVGLPPNFSIYDTADQTRVMKEALKLLEMNTSNFPPATLHGTISNAKNQLVTPEAYAQRADNFYERHVARVYAKYQQLLRQNNALDFDDLLMRTTLALRDHSQVLTELQRRFEHLMIDEYQDTNHAQYLLAHALASGHRNIAVVGDPDQSIYAWRGADIRNILEFERDYPDAVVVRLEQNYRSTKTILAIASRLIANNTQRKDKALWTENADGMPADLFLCQDEYDEAAVVVEQFRQLQRAGRNWSEMAVFYRMNALSRVMERALVEAGVPYQIARGVEFYNRKEIKDVLAYLRVVANPDDEVSLERILNVPTRGLGDTTESRLRAFASDHSLSLWGALQRASEAGGLSPRAIKSAAAFVEMVRRWRESAASSGGVRGLMERVIRESGYDAALRKLDPDEENEIPNVGQLVTSAAEFDQQNSEGGLVDYLAMISLIGDVDHMQGSGGAVTLMTLHAAKGLEFPIVAIIGLEEGCLPHARSRADPDQLEEERRLCFVGITRAQERLILSRAAYRTVRGLRERTITSPFLGELPEECVRVVDRTGVPSRDSFDRGESAPPRDDATAGVDATTFRRGQLVRHPSFGLGRIAEITDRGEQTRAVVEFNQAGRKTLILEYARLRPVAG